MSATSTVCEVFFNIGDAKWVKPYFSNIRWNILSINILEFLRVSSVNECNVTITLYKYCIIMKRWCFRGGGTSPFREPRSHLRSRMTLFKSKMQYIFMCEMVQTRYSMWSCYCGIMLFNHQKYLPYGSNILPL
uniref:Uncharacterized protein n=1 Tax=Lactuca sativa TaxID=4236 RepID=A0A9R1W5J9_LACSA|nr:hypothetical protein LSAT_V11C300118710 [Lactuca sativa]